MVLKLFEDHAELQCQYSVGCVWNYIHQIHKPNMILQKQELAVSHAAYPEH